MATIYNYQQSVTLEKRGDKIQEGVHIRFILGGEFFDFHFSGRELSSRFGRDDKKLNRFLKFLGLNGVKYKKMVSELVRIPEEDVWDFGVFNKLEEALIVVMEILKRYDKIHLKNTTSAQEEGSVKLSETFYGAGVFANEQFTCVNNSEFFLIEDCIPFYDEPSHYFSLFRIGMGQQYCCPYNLPDGSIRVYRKLQPDGSYESTNPTLYTAIPIIEELYPKAIRIGNNFYDEDYFIKKKIGYYNTILEKYVRGTNEIRHTNGDTSLSGYHENHTACVVKATTVGNAYFGIELERANVVRGISHNALAKDGWRCERDGSVAAEYISPVLSLDNYEESIEFIKATAQPILDGNISSSCGGHIHVSVKGITCEKLYKLCAPFMPLLWAIYPQRASNAYSQRPPTGNDAFIYNNRRDFVIKSEIGTVEFRIFPGCSGEQMLRFRLSLLDLIVRTATSGKEYSFADALEFIMSNEEIFEKLSYVYNTTEKLRGIAQRIRDCYASVQGANVGSDVTETLFLSLQEFVASKKKIVEESPEDVELSEYKYDEDVDW